MYFKSVFFHITHFSSTTYFLLQNQAFFSHNLQNWYSGILNSLREGLVQSQQSGLLNKIALSCFSRLSTWPLTGVLTYLNSLLIDPLSRVVKQTWANLCHCIALWFLCWLWTDSNQADFWPNRPGWLVNMCVKSVGHLEQAVVLSSYCSVVPSFILNMFLIASPVQLKIRCTIPMTIFVFQTFQTSFFDRKSLSVERYVNLDSVKNQFWHIRHIFALKCQ